MRHGRSRANAAGILAGRAEGVELDETGQAQARALAEQLRQVPIAAAYRSPILRCRQTAEMLGFPEATVVEGLNECDYGQWSERDLATLAQEGLWAAIQSEPSSVTFPGGESMLAMRERATEAITDIVDRHGPEDVVIVVSHGDPLKAILAEALGMPFDKFQRLHVAPASVSLVQYTDPQPRVLAVNTDGSILATVADPEPAQPGGGDSPRQ